MRAVLVQYSYSYCTVHGCTVCTEPVLKIETLAWFLKHYYCTSSTVFEQHDDTTTVRCPLGAVKYFIQAKRGMGALPASRVSILMLRNVRGA